MTGPREPLKNGAGVRRIHAMRPDGHPRCECIAGHLLAPTEQPVTCRLCLRSLAADERRPLR